MDNKSKNTIFMSILIAIGVALFIMVSVIEKNLDKGSKSLTFRNAIKSLWVIATTFVVMPISFFICRSTCSGSLGSYQKIQNNIDNLYLIFLAVMGACLITSGVFIKNEIDLNNDSNASSVWGIIGMGIASCLIPLVYLVISVISSIKKRRNGNIGKIEDLDSTHLPRPEGVRLKDDDKYKPFQQTASVSPVFKGRYPKVVSPAQAPASLFGRKRGRKTRK